MSDDINGDAELSWKQRLAYLWQNVFRNVKALRYVPQIRSFDVPPGEAHDPAGRSPGRLYTDIFLNRELPRLLSVSEPVTVLEIGCGSGSMVRRLAALGFRGRYTGIDIQDRFMKDLPHEPFVAHFECVSAHDYTPSDPVSLLVSVSALEHISGDGRLIARFDGFMAKGGVQVHIVPASGALLPYLWHGYRQYPASRLTHMFGEDIEIHRLGGLGSFLVHLACITPWEILLKMSFRKAAPGLYAPLLRAAVRLDPWFPIGATAYAIVKRH